MLFTMRKKISYSSSSYLILVLCVIGCHHVRLSTQFEMDSIGRVVRGHLGTLYDLRSKLGGGSTSSSSNSNSNSHSASPVLKTSSSSSSSSSSQQQQPQKKESRGYAFHYSSADVSHPVYSSSSNQNQEFHSRMGKVSDSGSVSSTMNKWKNSEKSWDKYAKLSYKTSPSSLAKDPSVNSFNIHQKMEVSSSSSSKHSPSSSSSSSEHYTAKTESPTSETVKTTSLPIVASPTTAQSSGSEPGAGVTATLGLNGLNPMQALSQGLNSAVTTVLTQKLMNLLDQEVPPTILNPLKHLVASGNRMVEFWDKKVTARDGQSPGIVEMMGYGLDQLKKFRDGQPLKTSDEVNEGTSASKTLIQGMLTVKKLTNRVLGYDTDEESGIESRGGYGDGGYGGGGGHGHVSYGHYLDPYAILATLGFGVFLFNVIFNLLNNQNNMMMSGRSLDVSDMDVPLALSDMFSSSNSNSETLNVDDLAPYSIIITVTFFISGYGGLDPFSLLAALAFGAFLLQLLLTMMSTSARSLDVSDMNTPLMMSDFHMPSFMTAADKIFGTPTLRSKRDVYGDESTFGTIVDKLDGMLKTYQQVSEQPKCIKLYLCRIAVQDTMDSSTGLLSKLYMYGVGHMAKDKSLSEFMKSVQERVEDGEEVNCDNIVKECVPKDLQY